MASTSSSSVDLPPGVQITVHNSSTGTLVDDPPSRSLTEVTAVSHDRSDIDSIWDADYEYLWEERRREEEVAVQELREQTPYLTIGFAVSPGQPMSRRTTRQGRRSALSTRPSSKAASAADLGKEELAVPPRLPPPLTFWGWLEQSRRRGRELMRLKRFHLAMIGLVAFDLMVVMVELILALLTASCTSEDLYIWLETAISHSTLVHAGRHLRPSDFACTLAPSRARDALEQSVFTINVSLLSVFTLEVFAALYAFGPITYCSSWVSILDGFVVIATLCLDVFFHLNSNPAANSPIALVILRLWKIFRAVHAIAHALELHYQEVVETAQEGHEKLEWERIAESLRLAYVRRALIKSRGEDVDPALVEEDVKRELEAIRARRAEEAAQAERDAEQTPACVGRWRRWFVNGFRKGN